MGILVSILIGALAGYLANHFMDRDKSSLIMNLLLGIVGAWVGNFVLNLIGMNPDGNWIGRIISATGGAVLLIYIMRWIRKKYGSRIVSC